MSNLWKVVVGLAVLGIPVLVAVGLVHAPAREAKQRAEIAQTMIALGCGPIKTNSARSLNGIEDTPDGWWCGDKFVDHTAAFEISRQRSQGEDKMWRQLQTKGRK